MEQGNIRKDREQARAALRGLLVYAEGAAQRGRTEEVCRIRRIVDEMSGYWGVDDQRDWTEAFDLKVKAAGQTGYVLPHSSSIVQLKAIRGLYRYAEEMAAAQGVDEIERILEISDVIQCMGKAWQLPQEGVKDVCCRIEEMVERLTEAQSQGMELG